jgi:hypothetical protein
LRRRFVMSKSVAGQANSCSRRRTAQTSHQGLHGWNRLTVSADPEHTRGFFKAHCIGLPPTPEGVCRCFLDGSCVHECPLHSRAGRKQQHFRSARCGAHNTVYKLHARLYVSSLACRPGSQAFSTSVALRMRAPARLAVSVAI